MEETDRNFARAGELLDAAEKLSPGNPSVLLQRAILHGRVKDYDKALAALDAIEKAGANGGLGPIEWSEKGLLLDKMGRHAEAFAAFARASELLRELTGQTYLEEEAASAGRCGSRPSSSRRGLSILPRADVRKPTSPSRSSSSAFRAPARR